MCVHEDALKDAIMRRKDARCKCELNHLKYICSGYFADGDSDGHFNCTEKAIIDLKLYKSVKFIFFCGLRSEPFL